MRDLQIFVVLLEPIVQKQEAMTFTPKPRFANTGSGLQHGHLNGQVRKADENTGDALDKKECFAHRRDNYGTILCEDACHESEDRLALEPVKIKPIYQLEDGWVACDLALLAFSGFFFSWFAAVVLFKCEPLNFVVKGKEFETYFFV